MTTPATTILPLRQALTMTILALVSNNVAPALNQALQVAMATEAETSTNIPVFANAGSGNKSNIVAGPLANISESTILVQSANEQVSIVAAGEYNAQMWTNVKLRQVVSADNAPEDFQCVSDCFADAMRDVFTSINTYLDVPLNASGQRVLPLGVAFTDSRIVSIIGPVSAKDENGTLAYYETTASHSCWVTVPATRIVPLA